MNELFRRFADKTSSAAGSSWTFMLAVTIIAIWIFSGPIFHFSNTWQLIINTGTTIVTFLMVFLIQNTQNRDSIALHLKLDELIKATKGARNTLVEIQDEADEEMQTIAKDFKHLHQNARHISQALRKKNRKKKK